MFSSPLIRTINLSILWNNLPISSESPATYKLFVSDSIKIPIFYNNISITVIKQDDSSVLDKVLELSPVISKQETDEIIKGLQCLDGEQLDPNENRCLPCTHYGLVWDPEHKVCKTMLKEEILKELDDFPEKFSPNVIMRPVYQESILPNLCYIGGGGELAYWFQLKNYFDVVNIPFPILLLRNSVFKSL